MQPGERGYDNAVIGMRLVLVVLLLLGWQFGHQMLGSVYIAAPLDVALRIVQIAANGQLWPHVGATLLASGVGFAIGWLLGFAGAVLLNFSPRAALAIEPYIMLAMGVPLFALIPLLILWFGIGITPKIVIVVSLVFFIVFISTFSGLRNIDRKLLDMARVMGASRGQIIAKVSRHAILPHVFSGLKIAVPRAISAAIVGEFLVADRGLGFYIEQSRQTVDPVGVFAGIVLVTLLVMLSDMVLGWLQRRAFRWQHVATLF
ncbi:MAG: ABC transporter permease [Betaproteobacteria bacterium]